MTTIMGLKTNRSEDQRLETLVNDFLDKYLFNKAETKFTNVEWVHDKERQIKGADIILSSPELNIDNAIVDIKSAVKYSNKYLGTYALELGFVDRSGVEREGWLTDKSKNTEYYLLLYPKSQKYYTDMRTIDDIDSVEYYLVERAKIISFLAENGYDTNHMVQTAAEMRDDYDGYSKNLILEANNGRGDFFFCLTGYLAEKPINVVIKRHVYDTIAKAHGSVTREKHTIL